jgi:putative transposase
VSAPAPTLATVAPRRPDPDVRRGSSSVYTLHAHLVFVTKYRRPVFTNPMLTSCEYLMRDVCTEIGTELREFTARGRPRAPTGALPAQPRHIGAGQPTQGHVITPAAPAVPSRYPEAPVGHALLVPSYFAASCGGAPLTIIKQYIEQQNRPD